MTENNRPAPPPDLRTLIPYSSLNDEIDLVDLGISLWRRWKLMLTIFLLCTGLGLALAFVLPRTYRYTAVVGLGSYIAANGRIIPVVTPDSAAASLNSGLIEMALLRYRNEHHVNSLKVKIVANVPSKSNIIVLKGTGTKRLQDTFETVEKDAVALLAQNTAVRANVLRSNLKGRLTTARATLTRIKLYQSQFKALNAHIARGRKESLTAARVGSPALAIGMLLINNQLQSNLQQMNHQESMIFNIKMRLGNIQETRLIVPPVRSIKHVGLRRAVVVILGAVVGVLLALLAAALANYVASVRRRLTPENP
ncbi:MAG TPA: hypothetical protein ENH27_04065 [Rhizobiales bacterium]|nr:hypothetical protein [Hyphomicrobiales bacterium]